jgi:hypothetical protein
MRRVPVGHSIKSIIALAALALAACSESGSERVLAPDDALFVVAIGPGNGIVQVERLEVCKVYAAGSNAPAQTDFTVGTGAPFTSFQLAPGECKELWHNGSANPVDNVTVTETVPSGFTSSTVITTLLQGGTPQTGNATAGNSVTVPIGGTGIPGALVVFTNTPIVIPSADGRMTGGGFTAAGVKITGGFTVHCDITLSNNLEINWDKNKWHLDKPITSAICLDDPNVDPTSPAAPFDTFIGEATGELNGVAGSLVKFTFVDAGEPGRNDMVKLQIFPPGGGSPVLDIPLSKLDIGNLQAHYDQPHGQKP